MSRPFAQPCMFALRTERAFSSLAIIRPEVVDALFPLDDEIFVVIHEDEGDEHTRLDYRIDPNYGRSELGIHETVGDEQVEIAPSEGPSLHNPEVCEALGQFYTAFDVLRDVIQRRSETLAQEPR